MPVNGYDFKSFVLRCSVFYNSVVIFGIISGGMGAQFASRTIVMIVQAVKV